MHQQCAADSLAPTDAAISSPPGSGCQCARSGAAGVQDAAAVKMKRAGQGDAHWPGQEVAEARERAAHRTGARRTQHAASNSIPSLSVVSTHPHDCHDFCARSLAFLSSPSSPPFSLSKRPIRHALHAPCSAPPIHGSRRQRIEMPLDLFTRAPYTDQYQ